MLRKIEKKQKQKQKKTNFHWKKTNDWWRKRNNIPGEIIDYMGHRDFFRIYTASD